MNTVVRNSILLIISILSVSALAYFGVQLYDSGPIAGLSALPSMPPHPKHIKIAPPPGKKMYMGAFVGEPFIKRKLSAFETISGKPLDILVCYALFGKKDLFPDEEAKIAARYNKVLFIKLEPWAGYGRYDKEFPLSGIIAGDQDALLTGLAKKLAAYGKPVFITFGHEMNGSWYPWSGDAVSYKKAFRHVKKTIESAGARNITWVWDPNIDFGKIYSYYPGDDAVDWIAVDGYNTSDWGSPFKSPSQLFGPTLSMVRKFNKPIMIGEYGFDSNDRDDDAVKKPKFIRQSIDYFIKNGVKAFIYFNQSKREERGFNRWALDTEASKNAFREALGANSGYIDNVLHYRITDGRAPETPQQIELLAEDPTEVLIENVFPFNGALCMYDGSTIRIKSTGLKDAGVGITLKYKVGGAFEFDHTSKVTGGNNTGSFSLVFIDASTLNYAFDTVLKETVIAPSSRKKHELVPVPDGCDKINIMLPGKGSMDIAVTGLEIMDY